MTNKDKLNVDQIKANLRTRRIGKDIIVYDSTSSTNDIAAEYAKNIENDDLVVATTGSVGGTTIGVTFGGAVTKDEFLILVLATAGDSL